MWRRDPSYTHMVEVAWNSLGNPTTLSQLSDLISIFIVYLISEIDKLKQLNSQSLLQKKIFRGGQRKFGKGVFSTACVDV
jgi:hypothetical protein